MKKSVGLIIGAVLAFTAGASVSHFIHPPMVNVAPSFAAPQLGGSPAIGGGVEIPPQAKVLTLNDLENAITAASSDKRRCLMPYVIWVEDNASVDMDGLTGTSFNGPDYLLKIPPCVTLASGRSATIDGGLLYLKNRPTPQVFMLSLGNGARVTGLRLQGPSESSDAGQVANGAILIGTTADSSLDAGTITNAMVDDNEISAWPGSAVNVHNVATDQSSVQQIRVSNNFIHDNVMCGWGYGTVVGQQGYAYVDRNLFNDNRHAVSDDGCVDGAGCAGNTGYIAELNFVMAEGAKCPSSSWFGRLIGFSYYNQHFDVHGLGPGCGSVDHCGGAASQYFDIRNNAIRGDQTYDNVLFWGKTRPAFELRGTPVELSTFRDNAVAHDNQGDAIDTPANNPQPNLQISNIQYNVDTSAELAVGDFDGDGCTDVFQATGTVWVYAPCGRREWRFLNQSSIRLSGLAFGDFDGDGRTDVFTQEGSQWLVSYAGTGPWTALPAGSNIPMSNYGFADFDGDGKTDIFESNGKEWFYSSGGASQWTHLNFSKLGIKDIRFGHFNLKDLKKTDVFAIVNGQWSVSYGGTSPWEKLNDKISDDIGSLVFGDFNGDGVTDIAYGAGNPVSNNATNNPNNPNTPPVQITWYVSWGGRSAWQPLNSWSVPANQYVSALSQMLIGHFGGQKRDDVIAQLTSGDDSLAYFFWSSGGMTPLAKRSVYTTK
jgi:hypothetical protein